MGPQRWGRILGQERWQLKSLGSRGEFEKTALDNDFKNVKPERVNCGPEEV